MLIIYNRIIPFKTFAAINLCGILFVRKGIELTEKDKQHEFIHTLQQREMLFLPFFLWYVMEWALKLVYYRSAYKAYRAISFEREAYARMGDKDYCRHRKHFAWMGMICIDKQTI